MKLLVCQILLLFIGVTTSHYSHFASTKLVTPSKGQPWPLPQHYASEQTFFTIQPKNFKFLHSSKCDIITNAVKRYQTLTFLDNCQKNFQEAKETVSSGNNVGQLYNLTIKIAGACEKYPYMNMDEQYLLKINSPDTVNQALLFSTTVWGALRGLETFSQLVYHLQPGLFAVNTTMVLDFPRFSYRGVLFDTSRHFIPVPLLLQNLDAMSYSKMNLFHFHIVDDQSFPYTSVKFPNMTIKGAFNPDTHVYSQEDIATIIEYGRLRGIRVLVEFDSPGHTLSWGKGIKNLLTSCYSGDYPNGNYGPIDPTKSETYEFLKSFFTEIAQVFPDTYVHLGGDEVSFDCWKSNPFIQNFMKMQGFGDDYSKLEEFYMQQLLDIVKSLNKSYIVWQEVFDNGVKVKPDTVIHIWKDGYQAELANVTAAGYNVILSSCWYLNYISYGPDWSKYYLCEPYDFEGSDSQKRLVIGGEACMWGEYVDGSNVISRTWPRTAAVAERLWSNKSATSVTLATPRLEELRCRMIRRGLKVEPVNGPGFCECDYLV